MSRISIVSIFLILGSCQFTTAMDEVGKRIETFNDEMKLLDGAKAKNSPKGPSVSPKADLISAYLTDLSLLVWTHKDQGKVLDVEIRKWEPELVKLYEKGAITTRERVGMKYKPLGKDKKVSNTAKLLARGKADEKLDQALLLFIACRRDYPKRGVSEFDGLAPVRIEANKDGVFDSHNAKGVVAYYVFYLRSQKSQKVKLKVLDLEKKDTLDQLWVNAKALKARPKGSVKADFRSGLNSIIVKVTNNGSGKLTIGLEVDGKELEVGF